MCFLSYSSISLFSRRENKPVSDFHLKISGLFTQRNLAQSPNTWNTQSCWGDGGACVRMCTAPPQPGPPDTESSVGSQGGQPLVYIQPSMSSQQTHWVDSHSYLFSLPRWLTHPGVPWRQSKRWKPHSLAAPLPWTPGRSWSPLLSWTDTGCSLCFVSFSGTREKKKSKNVFLFPFQFFLGGWECYLRMHTQF